MDAIQPFSNASQARQMMEVVRDGTMIHAV